MFIISVPTLPYEMSCCTQPGLSYVKTAAKKREIANNTETRQLQKITTPQPTHLKL
jgi:hypothetical protein